MKADTQNRVILARYIVAGSNLEKVNMLLKEMQALSQKEAGCLYYQPHQIADQPGTIILYEVYRNDEAVQAHRDSDHFRKIVLEQIVPLLESRSVEILSPL